jgi:hypothetical protein
MWIGDSFVSEAHSILLSAVAYDLQVVKVCGTCDTVRQYPAVFDTTMITAVEGANSSFEYYCGLESYGSTALHSGLLLVPLERQDYNTTTSNVACTSMGNYTNTIGDACNVDSSF